MERQPRKRRRRWMRALGAEDLYYMLTRVCRRHDARFLESNWVFDRCLEVEMDPDNRLDLWFRGGYKSSIITQTLTLQDIIRDPEITIGIFSHTRPNAVTFLEQIMREIEDNPLLHELWPDVFWRNPRRDSKQWSRQSGLILQRRGNPKEATLEAWGVVEGQPTGRHFDMMIYDDLVSREQVGSELMIAKTTGAMELSLNLGSKNVRRRFIGTRYHFADTYHEMMRRGMVRSRTYSARDSEGQARFYSDDELDAKRREQGLSTFSAQMLQQPTVDSIMGFREEWLKYYDDKEISHHGMNIYIICDPAHGKREHNDYTSIWVMGLSADRHYYALDFVRDRLTPTEIGKRIIRLHRYYNAGGRTGAVKKVGIERYGAMAHRDLIYALQREQNYRFEIIELSGQLKKEDRIVRLQKPFEEGLIVLPRHAFREDYEGKMRDIIHDFVHLEYLPYPAVSHDDGMDSLSRVLDEELNLVWPLSYVQSQEDQPRRRGTAWAM
ncbi:MAG: phage terminase large subunit [Geminicoccaceae bacterium]